MYDEASLRRFLDPEKSSSFLRGLQVMWQDRQIDDLLAILTLLGEHGAPAVRPWARERLDVVLALSEEQQRWLVTIPSMSLWLLTASYIAAGNPSPPEILKETGFTLIDLDRYLMATSLVTNSPSPIRLKLDAYGRQGLQGTGVSLEVTEPVEVEWDGSTLRCISPRFTEEFRLPIPQSMVSPWAPPVFGGQLMKVWLHPVLGGRVEIEPRDHYLTRLFEDQTRFVRPSAEVGKAMIKVLENAVSTLNQIWPRMLDEIFLTDKQVLWVENPDRPDEINSFSDNSVPGALYFSMAQSKGLLPPEDVLDSLVHEHLHQKLYLLEAAGPLFDPMPGRTFTSPWRTDPRPIGGVFHGYFVFYGLRALWTRAVIHDTLRVYAEKRVMEIEGQLRVAREILEQNAVFTPTGANLFAVMGDTRL